MTAKANRKVKKQQLYIYFNRVFEQYKNSKNIFI